MAFEDLRIAADLRLDLADPAELVAGDAHADVWPVTARPSASASTRAL